MATGSTPEESAGKALDLQGKGQSVGVPADGEVEGSAFNPLGNPGMKHWQAGYIENPSLQDRGNIFFAAVEMTRMPMVVTDPRQPDNPIAFANRAFLDLTLYEEKDVIGRNCRFLQGPQTDPNTVDEIRAALAERRAVAVDVLNYKADGSAFWNALYIGPIFDQDGELLYFFASQMDITQRRAIEQSSVQAQKMEAIGQLTAGMAHDFNNLLQVINGNLELAMLALGPHTRAAEPIQRAQRAAMKAGKLTQQLLTFARKQRLEPRRVNLNALLAEFSDLLVRTLGDRVRLQLDLHPGLPSCWLDPTHLEMALLNVIINARDAMPEGGAVWVRTQWQPDRPESQDGPAASGQVIVSIIDEGEGMAPEVMRRATEPFFTTKGPGTGLGLAMVHGFVQQSRGRLELDSTPGRGTTVRMIFPADSKEEAATRADATQPASAEEQASKPRILVVEDNEDVRELAESVLGGAGYAVMAVPSGEQALALLTEGKEVDLIFTDVMMPGGMNGLQLADQVRARRPDTPILITTGYMDELPAVSRTQPFDILTKPYHQEELLSRVLAILPRAAATE
ncbi:response regulator [Massilia sp. Dwa41.01b]|uniref:histidine kinase famiy protein n=1 Tax=unclassified Massilia TaxID=2609279 RepID=UPI0015FECB0F|nr:MULTISPECIES: histidine kinase famiy protein [unclassified Massilia]QNA90330.1 response regulator [Massilia sp. Dwa41.01b]QNB01229.1 response regulator [Massilia sp. Se16.2.3]